MKSKLHPAWIVAGITFGTLFATAGFRSAPSVLILPLEEEFGWRRDVISFAIAIFSLWRLEETFHKELDYVE